MVKKGSFNFPRDRDPQVENLCFKSSSLIYYTIQALPAAVIPEWEQSPNNCLPGSHLLILVHEVPSCSGF